MGSILAVLISLAAYVAARLVLLGFVILVHLRWKVRLAVLERLLRASALTPRPDRGSH
jgi:hypothetical protein